MPAAPARSDVSLVADRVAFSRGGPVVLDGVDVAIAPRTRLGIVGPNGVGKSTLLRILGGLQEPDRGRVTRTPTALRVAYLNQERGRVPETVRALLERRSGVAAAAATFDAYLDVGCADFEARAATVVADLGLAPDVLERRWTLCPVERPPGRADAAAAGPRRRAPARRADQRPRLRRPRTTRAVPRVGAGWCRRREP